MGWECTRPCATSTGTNAMTSFSSIASIAARPAIEQNSIDARANTLPRAGAAPSAARLQRLIQRVVEQVCFAMASFSPHICIRLAEIADVAIATAMRA